MRNLRRVLIVGTTMLALVVHGLAVPSVATAAESATLGASEEGIGHGDDVILSGAVTGDAACVAGRSVSLEARRADEPAFVPIAQSTAAPDGSFSFTHPPEFTALYRVSLPAAGACLQVTSNEARVAVAAAVEGTIEEESVPAGSCVEMSISVRPAKGGQQVEVRQRSGGKWKTITTVTLDASSMAIAKVCPQASDSGTVRLRAEWIAQDELNDSGTGAVQTLEIGQAAWMTRIESLTDGRAVSVSVGEEGQFLYQRQQARPRTPASNQKLLLSMALLEEVGEDFTIETQAAATPFHDGVVKGDLWILGRGDPTIGRAALARLAQRVQDAGVSRVRGSVMGNTGYFRHDWFAPGWKPDFPELFVALPSALTFESNTAGGVHIGDPERRAAAHLTEELEERGVAVSGKPGAGNDPSGLATIAAIQSRPLPSILRRMNVDSINFRAEVLGKVLGVQRRGTPGTIAKGAAVIEDWCADNGVNVTALDSSGLSYGNRVTAQGIVRLLWVAEAAPWGTALRDTLPTGGQGTLEHRLRGVKVRAKTGSLTEISALSGWIWLRQTDSWAEFSILSRGMPKDQAASIEDAIVRTIARSAG